MAAEVQANGEVMSTPVLDTGLFRMLADFAESSGTTLQDPQLVNRIAEVLISQLEAVASNPMVRYGVHTEAMFEWVVSALGSASLIQALDGQRRPRVHGNPATAPDYLVVTSDGDRLAVEVKNCAAKNARRKFTRDYLLRLKRYADTLSAIPLVAIFWTNLTTWTLVDVNYMLERTEADNLSISFSDAFAESEMYRLGDVLVYLTSHPFRFRMDFSVHSREDKGDGSVSLGMVVEDAAMFLDDTRIREESDQRVLWYLALHGLRLEGGDDLHLDSAGGASIEFESDPDLVSESLLQAGIVSSMLSMQYRSLSCDDDGKIARLSTTVVDDQHVCRLLASGYQGKDIGFEYVAMHPRRLPTGGQDAGV